MNVAGWVGAYTARPGPPPRAGAQRRGETLTQVLERAVEEEEQRELRRQLQEAAARLKGDHAAWAAYRAYLAEVEGTSGDGIAEGEWDDEWQQRAAITW